LKAKIILALIAILLMALPVSAAVLVQPVSDCPYSPSVREVQISGKASGGKIDFTWTIIQDGASPNDFNNYVIKAVGNRAENSIPDMNFTGNSYSVFNASDGDSVTFYVQPWDGNIEETTGISDYNCGADFNTTVTVPTIAGGIKYLVYAVFAGFAVVFVLIIMAALVAIILGKFNLKGMLRK